MGRFGEYLVQQGLLSTTQLEEAISHQSVYGDRLGTNLVDLHMLTVEQLAECLSGYHQVPLPPRKWLERPRKPALKRVTRPLVERIRFVPLRLDGNVMHAAVLDPRDPSALDDLRFATGCRIKPYVLPEIWMHDWLLTLFKIPRGIRHVESDAATATRAEQGSGGFDVRAAQSAQMDASAAPAAAPAQAVQAQMAASVGPAAGAPVATLEHAAAPPSAELVALPEPFAPAPSRGPVPSEVASVSEVPGSSVRPPQITVCSLADIASAIGSSGVAAQAASAAVGVPEPPSLWDAPVAKERAWPADGAEFEVDPPLPDLPSLPVMAPAGVQAPAQPMVPLPAVPPVGLPVASLPGRDSMGPAAPTPLAVLEQQLGAAADRDALIDTALRIAERFAHRLGLFIVQQGIIQGVRHVEAGKDRTLAGVLVPVDTPCLLTEVIHAGEPRRAVPSGQALDARILDLMCDQDAQEVGVFPVGIKGRVVNVLYASNGSTCLGRVAFDALAGLAVEMGAAYERLILARKR